MSPWLFAVGLFCGLISGFFGIGGGIVFVPFMHLVLKLDLRAAVGTSLWIIAPTALAGAINHWRLGSVEFAVLALFIGGGVLGAMAGSFLVYQVPQKLLQQLYGAFLFIVSIKLLMGK